MPEPANKLKKFFRLALGGPTGLFVLGFMGIVLYHVALNTGREGIQAEKISELPSANYSMRATVPHVHSEGILRAGGANVVRAASLEVETQEFDSSVARIAEVMRNASGFADEIKIHRPANSPRWLEARLRVPASSLGSVLGELKSLGRVAVETESSEDTQTEKEMLRGQVDSKRSDFEQLKQAVRQRHGSLGDVLKAEEDLSERRQELRELENRLKRMEARVEYALLDLRLFEAHRARLDWRTAAALPALRNSFVEGVEGILASSAAVLAALLKYGIPLGVWAAPFYLLARPVWRRWRRATLASVSRGD